MDIHALLSEHESARLEFKEQLPANEKVAALLCAFANTAGGDLVVGVEDKTRKVIGVPESHILDMEEKLSAIAATGISPMVFPIIKVARHKGKALVVVHLDMGFQKPYRVVVAPHKGKVFVRIGSSTRQADPGAEEAMQLQSHGLSWDCLACRECTVADLDKALIKEFVEKRFERRGIAAPTKVDLAWLRKMRFALSQGGDTYPSNGAIVLFTQAPHELNPSICIEMARFSGTEGRDFLDKRTATGPVWKLYEEARLFLRRHINVHAPRSAAARQERLTYPEIAFREFMVNALCHRSFEGEAGPVRLAIFEDVIQITNPGSLPAGLDIDDIGTGISVIRNPLIARVFNELGLIEGWGTGIQVAQAELAKCGLPPARIEQKGFFLQVTSSWRMQDGLSENDTVILRETASRSSVSSETAAKLLGMSDRAARKILASLVERELLTKIGSTKGTIYRLK